MQQQPDQTADQRAVDADVLQVLADTLLHLLDQFAAFPIFHTLGNVLADLSAVTLEQARRGCHQLFVDPVAHGGVGGQGVAQALGQAHDPFADTRIRAF